MNAATQKKILIVTFVALPLLLLIVFTYFPSLLMFYYSVFDWNGLGNMRFVGVSNYLEVFTNQELFGTLINSIYYFIGAVVQMAIGLMLAVFLSFKLKGTNFFKGTLFFPYLINGVAVGLMFVFFFKPDGMLNLILMKIFGAEDTISFLTVPVLNNTLLAGVSIWRYLGFNLVMFIGAIQSIPGDIYEAAKIDGANEFQVFLRIIFPMIRNVALLNLILAIKGAVSVFEVPYIMTTGGFGTSTFVIETITLGMKGYPRRVGLASAMCTVLFVIIVVVTLVQQKAFGEKKEIKEKA